MQTNESHAPKEEYKEFKHFGSLPPPTYLKNLSTYLGPAPYTYSGGRFPEMHVGNNAMQVSRDILRKRNTRKANDIF